MKHKGYNNNVSSLGNSTAQKLGYLGQEHQDELGLGWISYKWRNADPALGRFFGIDPIAEDYPNQILYQFASNNPVWKIEIEGLEGFVPNGNDVINGLGFGVHTVFPSQDPIISRPTITQVGGGTGRSGDYVKTNRSNNSSVKFHTNEPLITDVRVEVSSSLGADGLQIIQTVNAEQLNNPDLQEMNINGEIRTAFVDGGPNSPGQSGNGNYYNSEDDLNDVNYANAIWDNNTSTGQITIFDIPTAVVGYNIKDITFDTTFVLTNYGGSGKDQVVGSFTWSFSRDKDGNIIPHATPVKATSNFSETSQKIIDYEKNK